MKYKEKLLQLIQKGKNSQEFQEWLASQPILEQPAIMRELKQLSKLSLEEGGINSTYFEEYFEKYDAVIDKFEDTILDKKLGEQQLIMAQEDLEKLVQQMRKTHPQLREQVIEAIVKNEPNAPLMRSLAKKIIELEKKDNSYNHENWKQLPEQ